MFKRSLKHFLPQRKWNVFGSGILDGGHVVALCNSDDAKQKWTINTFEEYKKGMLMQLKNKADNLRYIFEQFIQITWKIRLCIVSTIKNGFLLILKTWINICDWEIRSNLLRFDETNHSAMMNSKKRSFHIYMMV